MLVGRFSVGRVVFAVGQDAKDCVQNGIEMLTDIFGQKSQHEVAVLLQEQVFPAVAAVGFWRIQMLSAIEFDCQFRVGTQQVNFHMAVSVERNWKFDIHAESTHSLRKRLQPAE
jgi:hypothetical protein